MHRCISKDRIAERGAAMSTPPSARPRVPAMSSKTLQNILELCDSIDRHSSLVEERMRNAGFSPDPLLAESVAKYWSALEKLAGE